MGGRKEGVGVRNGAKRGVLSDEVGTEVGVEVGFEDGGVKRFESFEGDTLLYQGDAVGLHAHMHFPLMLGWSQLPGITEWAKFLHGNANGNNIRRDFGKKSIYIYTNIVKKYFFLIEILKNIF